MPLEPGNSALVNAELAHISLLPHWINRAVKCNSLFASCFRAGLGIPQPGDLHLPELFRNPSQYSSGQQSEVCPSGWLGRCSSGGTCTWDLKYQRVWVTAFYQQSCKTGAVLKMISESMSREFPTRNEVHDANGKMEEPFHEEVARVSPTPVKTWIRVCRNYWF